MTPLWTVSVSGTNAYLLACMHCLTEPILLTAGFPASKLFGQGVSYTYDDVIFLPGHINFAAHEVGSLAHLQLSGLELAPLLGSVKERQLAEGLLQPPIAAAMQ